MHPSLTAALCLALAATWTSWNGTGRRVDPPFRVSTDCATCHDNATTSQAMRDEAGNGIAPYDLWRSTMMANAARDPFWRAAVAREAAATPTRAQAIEEKCMRCHAPMAAEAGHGDTDRRVGLDLLAGSSETARLGQDGVSCTVCHAITSDGLGQPSSWSGGYVIDARDRAFGPHANPFSMPMSNWTGLTPTQAGHVTESRLCATCHTLRTSPFAADGSASTRTHEEQSPYLEWRNSAFDEERSQPGPKAASCQDCHAPTTSAAGKPLSTRIAHNPMGRDFPIAARSPYGRHLFVGANTLVPAILRDNAATLGVTAPRAAFDATIAAARDQLANRTASLSWARVERQGDELRVRVKVTNLAGHKLPTAYPSRRTWLHVRVLDAASNVVLESGAYDAAGRILDGVGKPLPSELAGGPVEPHRDVVTKSAEVQVWEAVMQDVSGKPTWLLLRAAGYAKDDRLLPEGWSAQHADAAATAPVGTSGDADHAAGSDGVEYRVQAPASAGPYRIEAELVLQVLGSRYMDEFARSPAKEVQDFVTLWKAADRRPERVATATTTAK